VLHLGDDEFHFVRDNLIQDLRRKDAKAQRKTNEKLHTAGISFVREKQFETFDAKAQRNQIRVHTKATPPQPGTQCAVRRP
jgi:hypothetical protein